MQAWLKVTLGNFKNKTAHALSNDPVFSLKTGHIAVFGGIAAALKFITDFITLAAPVIELILLCSIALVLVLFLFRFFSTKLSAISNVILPYPIVVTVLAGLTYGYQLAKDNSQLKTRNNEIAGNFLQEGCIEGYERGKEPICVVNDPDPPLNIRNEPAGQTIIGKLDNEKKVRKLRRAKGPFNKQWSYVVEVGGNQREGWVFNNLLKCELP